MPMISTLIYKTLTAKKYLFLRADQLDDAYAYSYTTEGIILFFY